ncbi:MAG TPA: FAD-dependent oxidoreductase [Polyangiaceae bacterium]|jgi:2-polyprenyl-6-methoxyphenol hydroxylase-like FAD-dependent oxidoreductase|nr:FAD-dependent oxidoreductase [Polyangiaceae bacterium]
MNEPQMREQRTVCIVGGGPAGVLAGVLFARAGVDTLVLEKHSDFLRDFRGDTVHPSTMDVLGELGWLDDFLRMPHQELSRIQARIGDTLITLGDFSRTPTRKKFIALMPQWDFLNFIAEKAKALPAFSLKMNATVTDLVEEQDKVVGVRASTPEGSLEVRADLVIVADGRSSTLRERAGLRVRDIGAPIDVLWVRLSRRSTDPKEALGWVQRGRFLALIDRGDYWQIAYLIEKGGHDALVRRGIDAFRRDLAATTPFLGDRVNELRSFDDVKLLVVKVDRLDRWWRPGLLCIGDAAHAMSPIGGVGINLAIQDAVAASNLLAGPLRRHELSDDDLRKVQRRRELPTRATQALQVAIQRRVIQRALTDERGLKVGPVVKFLDRVELLKSIPAHLVGVGFRPEHVDGWNASPSP